MADQPFFAPVRSKTIDMRTLVAALDPRYRDPPDVYIMPNGRKFKEFPEDQSVFAGTVYGSSDGTAFYGTASAKSTLYAVKP
jgi:hypothetical protein